MKSVGDILSVQTATENTYKIDKKFENITYSSSVSFVLFYSDIYFRTTPSLTSKKLCMKK